MTDHVMTPDEKLALHSVGVHKNARAIANSFTRNAELHWHEHNGPGGLRDHTQFDLSFDEREVEKVLEEAEPGPAGLSALQQRAASPCPDVRLLRKPSAYPGWRAH